MTGIGIDIVRVERFQRWYRYSDRALGRLFSQYELAKYRSMYVVGETPKKNLRATQFLASRFAAREAFFKAVHSYFLTCGTKCSIRFLELCRRTCVRNDQTGVPILKFDLPDLNDSTTVQISISHESCCAVAVVLIT